METRAHVEIEEGLRSAAGSAMTYNVTVTTRTSLIVDNAEEAAKLFVEWQDRKVRLKPIEEKQ